MVKRIRNHKAEYQRRKQIAAASGAKSVREYKRQRKTAALPRSAKLIPARFRQESKEWSEKHSRLPTSKYKPTMTETQLLQYHNAFVRDYDSRDDKLEALFDYLVGNNLITGDEWEQNYLPR